MIYFTNASRATVSLVCLFGLAACGGTTVSDEMTTPPRVGTASGYAELESMTKTLFFGIAPGGPSDQTALPMIGSATYDGPLIIVGGTQTTTDVNIAGEMRMIANFVDDTVSGDFVNVFDSDENAYGGQLDISEGVIARTRDPMDGYTFKFDLDGTLTNSTVGDVTVDAEYTGDFRGDDRANAIASPDGVVTHNNETYDIIGGRFYGELQ